MGSQSINNADYCAVFQVSKKILQMGHVTVTVPKKIVTILIIIYVIIIFFSISFNTFSIKIKNVQRKHAHS